MKVYLILFLLYIFTGCSDNPDVPKHEETLAKQKIEHNKLTALQAQEAYLKLQKQREND